MPCVHVLCSYVRKRQEKLLKFRIEYNEEIIGIKYSERMELTICVCAIKIESSCLLLPFSTFPYLNSLRKTPGMELVHSNDAKKNYYSTKQNNSITKC